MYLDDNSPIAGGREIWGFPKKLATPKMVHEQETLVGTLHYGSVLCVVATMGYKHQEIDLAPVAKSMAKPAFMIKIIPHVDGTPRICELVRYYMQDVDLKGAWSGPAALEFSSTRCATSQSCRCARSSRRPLYRRPDARPRRGRVRLSEGMTARLMRDEFKLARSVQSFQGRPRESGDPYAVPARKSTSASGLHELGGYGSPLSIGERSDAVLRTAMGTTLRVWMR